MFRSCFVATLSEHKSRSVNIICQFTPVREGSSDAPLPSATNLGAFCFPIGPENVKQREYMAPVEYSFTLTGGDGSRLHGFCRSFLPPRTRPAAGQPSSTMRYPQVLCLISPHPFFTLYYKVLQVVEVLLKQGDMLTALRPCAELPLASPVSFFLEQLCREAGPSPAPGLIMRLDLPSMPAPVNVSPPRRLGHSDGGGYTPLQSTERWIELEIPPDTGNGAANAGIPLARLLWALPVPQLVALLEALLLEKRVLFCGPEPDTVSAAAHAAAALLYPFRWVHIFLPLLPHGLKDYLLAPMPFLVGLPAPHAVNDLARIPLEDVVVVDLELGTVRQGLRGPPLLANYLPWADRLQAALQMVYGMLRSPTEYESTPMIAELMQEYMLRLMMQYGQYIRPEGLAPSPDGPGPPLGSPTVGRRQHNPDDGYLRAYGYVFDHNAFVASHRRDAKARVFLDMFRHSQMYEQFITERLRWAATRSTPEDRFEAKVAARVEKRSQLGKQLMQASVKSANRLSEVLRKTSNRVKAMRQGDGDQAFVNKMGKQAYQPHLSGPPAMPPDSSLPPATEGVAQDPASWFSDMDDSDSDSDSVSSMNLPFVLRAHRQGAQGPLSTGDASRTEGASPSPPRQARGFFGTRFSSPERSRPPLPHFPFAGKTPVSEGATAAVSRALLTLPSLMDAEVSPIWVPTPQGAGPDRLAEQVASLHVEAPSSLAAGTVSVPQANPLLVPAPTAALQTEAQSRTSRRRTSSLQAGIVAPVSVSSLDPFSDLLGRVAPLEPIGRRVSTALAPEWAPHVSSLPTSPPVPAAGPQQSWQTSEAEPLKDRSRMVSLAEGDGVVNSRRSTYEWTDWAGADFLVSASSGNPAGLKPQGSLLDL